MIKKIKVKNFKSFKDLELSLGKVNILIGANASGKSNFVQIFKFLRDISMFGLENAISMQDGIEYLSNINIGSSETFSLEITYGQEILKTIIDGFLPQGIKLTEIVYNLTIASGNNKSKYTLIEDSSTLRYTLPESEQQNDPTNGKRTKLVEITISNVKGQLHIKFNPSDWLKEEDKGRISQILFGLMPLRELHLSESIVLGDKFFGYSWQSISVYDFDPKPSKMAFPIAGKADLEEDGRNLVIVVKNILSDPEKKRMFLNLVNYLLPYVKDIEVDKFTETYLYLKINEIYSEKQYLPASLISDGTINALGLIVALYFQESPLIIIEEPDRGFHPSLISSVIDMMRDAAEYGNKQIIVTTHNPEMVRHADPKNILLVSRNEKGFSSIKKPYRKKDVKIFLENGMRLSDLYVDELLEI